MGRADTLRRLAEALDLDFATCLVAADLAHEDQAAQGAARLSDDGMMAERVCTLVRRVRWTEDRPWHVELLPTGCMERDRVRAPSIHKRETANDQDAIIEMRS